MTTLTHLLLTSLVVLLGHIIKSISGFGAALISIPILSNFLDLKFLVPLFTLFDLFSGSIVVAQSKKSIATKKIVSVVIGLLLGTALGTKLLINLQSYLLRKLFGFIIGIFALQIVFFPNISLNDNKAFWGIIAGFLGGLTGAMFGVNGPPIIIYLTYQIKNKTILRNSLFAIFLVDAVWKTSLYSISGILTVNTILSALTLIPLILMGLFIGKKIHINISDIVLRKVIGVFLLANSLFILL